MAAISSPLLLAENREDLRIGIVWESIFTFRHEIIKEDMPGNAFIITIEARPIGGVLQMPHKGD
jgi:hypothetical protein